MENSRAGRLENRRPPSVARKVKKRPIPRPARTGIQVSIGLTATPSARHTELCQKILKGGLYFIEAAKLVSSLLIALDLTSNQNKIGIFDNRNKNSFPIGVHP